MRKGEVAVLCGVISLLLLGTGAYARSDKKGIQLETVVVTGSRVEEKIERVPANVTVINEEDITHSNAKNLVELLRSEEGVVVRDLLGNGKTAQVDLRGFGEAGPYNTLVLVDGRRVNPIDLSGVDWTQVPLGQIERIEIVRGTGSVLYGDNAVGGVINIITKTPSEKLTFTAGTIVGSYGRNKEQISISGGGESGGASLFASYDSTNGYRDNNGFRGKDVGGKIVFDPTEFLSLNLSGSYHTDDYGMPGSVPEAQLDINRRGLKDPLEDKAEGTDQYLKAGVELDLCAYGRIATDIAYRDLDGEAEFNDEFFGMVFTTLLKSERQTWSLTPRYVWDGKISTHKNTLIAGMDLYWSEYDLETFSGPPLALSGVAHTKKNSYGLYFNNEFSIRENLILSLGARRERARYDLSQQDVYSGSLNATVTEHEYAYSAGLTFLYGAQSSLFFRTNRSLRFPLVDELVEFAEISPFVYQLQLNSDLKPQVGKHYEVGVKHYLRPGVRVSVTLFRAEIKDEIFLDKINFPPFGSNVNHPETLHQGLEIGSRADFFKNLTLFGNYTYENATFKKDPFKGNQIPAVPRHKTTVGFRIHDLIPGFIFSSEYNYVGTSYAISDQANQFEKLEKYHTINAKLSYGWKLLKAFVGVNNLTDEKYSDYAIIGGTPKGREFHPAPGRNWVGGLEISF